MYPEKLVDFIKSSSPNERKALSKFGKFRPDLQALLKPFVLEDMNECFYRIANDYQYWPECECCEKPAMFKGYGNGYSRWCSQSCYTKSKNPSASKFVYQDVEYSSIKDAMSKTGLSRHLLLKEAKLGKAEVTSSISEKERLQNKHALLLNSSWLLEQKRQRKSIRDIAKELIVSENFVSDAFIFHKLDTKYDQVSEEARLFLENESALKDFINSEALIHTVLEKYSITGPTLTKALEKFDLEYNNKIRSKEQYAIYQMIESWGFDCIYDTRKIITPKEIDIFIPSLNIGIEYNGVYFHKEGSEKSSKYHQDKWKASKEKGIRLIQIFEDDWLSNKRELIIKKLKHILGISSEKKIFARKCEVVILTNSEVRSFFELNHIQGHKNAKEIFALKHENEIVAAVSFKGNKLERFATSANIVGGFSKLLKASGKTEINTYADLCWSDSDVNVYTKNGFILTGITQPGYFWVVKGKRERREKYMKKNLVNMKGYSSDLTEHEIMHLNGYFRIFDAGHAKLEYK